MAEIKLQGRVVEARENILGVKLPGGGPEEWLRVRRHDALPGDYVWIYDDGQVEVKNRPPRLPEGVTERTFPTTVNDHDHG